MRLNGENFHLKENQLFSKSSKIEKGNTNRMWLPVVLIKLEPKGASCTARGHLPSLLNEHPQPFSSASKDRSDDWFSVCNRKLIIKIFCSL